MWRGRCEGRRTDLGLSQVALARRAGVSRKWISEFEAGNLSAEIGLVLRVLDALGMALDLISGDNAAPLGGANRVDLDEILSAQHDR
jgi:HTH-type transcriptional regulator/antitoxin HipB